MSTKEYLKYDMILAVFLGAYYFLTRGSLAATTSTGIQTFYMIEIGVAVLLQVLLMIFDNTEARPWVASMRCGAIVYLLGMVLIVTKLGLLSVWFIILFCASEGIHISLLLDQSQNKDYNQ